MAICQAQKKIGGRTSGIPNIRSKYLFEDLLKRHKFDPAEHIIKILPQLEIRDQAQVCVALMPYVYARKEPESINVLMVLQKFGKDSLEAMNNTELEEAIAGVIGANQTKTNPIGSQGFGDLAGRKEEEESS